MSLFDDWNAMGQGRNTGDGTSYPHSSGLGNTGYSSNTNSGSHYQRPTLHPSLNKKDEPMFQLEVQQLQFHQSTALCFAAASNVLLIATAQNNLVRFNVEEARLEEYPLKVSNEGKIVHLYLSPDAIHTLISMSSGTLIYFNNTTQQIIPITGFKHVVTSSQWYIYPQDKGKIQRVLLGTATGYIYTLTFTMRPNHPGECKQGTLTQLYPSPSSNDNNNTATSNKHNNNNNAITNIRACLSGIPIVDRLESSSLNIDTRQSSSLSWFIIFTTYSCEYTLVGGPTIEEAFSQSLQYDTIHHIEFPTRGNISCLSFYIPDSINFIDDNIRLSRLYSGALSPIQYTWINDVICKIAFLDPESSDLESIIPSNRLIDLPSIPDQKLDNMGMVRNIAPISILLTQFHVICLYPQQLCIINILNNNIVLNVPLPRSEFGQVISLACDELSNTYWLLSDSKIVEIVCLNELNDVWTIFLDQGDYSSALQYSQTNEQTLIINGAKAESLFAQGDYTEAAHHYHRSNIPVERVVLKYLIEYQNRIAAHNSNNTNNNTNNPSSNSHFPSTLATPSALQFISPQGKDMLTSLTPLNNVLSARNNHFGDDQQHVSGGLSQSFITATQGTNGPTSSVSLLGSNNTSLSYANNNNNNMSVSSYAGFSNQLISSRYALYCGLKSYIRLILDNLRSYEKIQLSLLSAWLVELYSNNLVALESSLNKSAIASTTNNTNIPNNNDKSSQNNNPLFDNNMKQLENERLELYKQECDEFKTFLEEYHDLLHQSTTFHFLSTSGRTEELIYYARLCGAYDMIVDIYVRHKDFSSALDSLKQLRQLHPNKLHHIPPKQQNSSSSSSSTSSLSKDKQPPQQQRPLPRYIWVTDPDLIYRTIPILLLHIPSQVVDFLVDTDGLSCTRILSGLVRCGLRIQIDSNAIADQQEQITAAVANKVALTNKSSSSSSISSTINNLNLPSDLANTLQSKINNSSTQQQHTQQQKKDKQLSLTNPNNPENGINHLHDPIHVTGVLPHQHNKNPKYLYDVARYLEYTILADIAPMALHNLYIATLIQINDITRLLLYIKTRKHSNYYNRVFALKLCSSRDPKDYCHVIIELCLQLQRPIPAIRLALQYDIDYAKEILFSYNHTVAASFNNRTTRLELWREYIYTMISHGDNITDIINDVLSWNHGQFNLTHVLPCLPPNILLKDIYNSISLQLTTFHNELVTYNTDMNTIRHINNTIKQDSINLTRQYNTILPTSRCDICSRTVLLSPILYFHCTHIFHTSCCVNATAQYINIDPQRKRNIYIQQLNMLTQGKSNGTSSSSSSNTTITSSNGTSIKTASVSSSQEVLDLLDINEYVINQLRERIMNGTLSSAEEQCFIEQHAQESCFLCGDAMVHSTHDPLVIQKYSSNNRGGSGYNHDLDSWEL